MVGGGGQDLDGGLEKSGREGIGKELAGFFVKNGEGIAWFRRDLAFFVDAALCGDGGGLIGWECVAGKKSGRMAGEAVAADHAQPGINTVKSSFEGPACEPFLPSLDFRERAGVEKDIQFLVKSFGGREVHLVQTAFYFPEVGWEEARFDKDAGEGIAVIADDVQAVETGFQQGGAASGEGVVNGSARGSLAFKEKGRELGLEAGAVGNLVQRMSCALAGGPEFAPVNGNRARAGVFLGGLRWFRTNGSCGLQSADCGRRGGINFRRVGPPDLRESGEGRICRVWIL